MGVFGVKGDKLKKKNKNLNIGRLFLFPSIDHELKTTTALRLFEYFRYHL